MRIFLVCMFVIMISTSKTYANEGNLAWAPPNFKKCSVTFDSTKVKWSFKRGKLQFGSVFPTQIGFVNKKRKVWLEKSGSNALYRRKKGTVTYTLVGLGAGQAEGIITGPYKGKYKCK